MSLSSNIPTPWPGPDFTITFKTSRLKMFLMLVVCLIGFVACVGLGQQNRDVFEPVVMYLCAGLCALGLMAFLVQLHPRASYLTFKKEGFAFCSLFRVHEVHWSDVQRFEVQNISHNKMVVWNYVPEFSTHIRGRRIATALAGCEAALPDTYGFKAEDLADVMNQMRERHLLESSPGS